MSAGHQFLVQKFRADAEIGGVRKAALRWKKQGAPLNVMLAVMRDALNGTIVVCRDSTGGDIAWLAERQPGGHP